MMRSHLDICERPAKVGVFKKKVDVTGVDAVTNISVVGTRRPSHSFSRIGQPATLVPSSCRIDNI